MGYGFSSLHPLPSFLYYLGAIILIMTFYNPIFLLAGLLILIAINFIQDRGKKIKSYRKFYIFMAMIIIFMNPIISSRGETVLFYIFDRVITLESLVYGICTAISLISIMVLFLSYNMIITEDKFMYLFSDMLPKTSFLIMMTMGFIPLLKRRITEINTVQELKGGKEYGNKFKEKLIERMKVLNILLIWSLEESIIRARSMRARGYGAVQKRSFYFNYRMDKLDIFTLLFIIFAVFTLMFSWNSGIIHYEIYPKVSSVNLEFKTILFFILYILYLGIPIIIEGMDKLKWHK